MAEGVALNRAERYADETDLWRLYLNGFDHPTWGVEYDSMRRTVNMACAASLARAALLPRDLTTTLDSRYDEPMPWGTNRVQSPVRNPARSPAVLPPYLPPAASRVFELQPRPHLRPVAQEALRSLVICGRLRQAVVTAVDEVANTDLWNAYTIKRAQVVQSIDGRRDCPWIRPVAPGNKFMERVIVGLGFVEAQLDNLANEVLLLHATSESNAKHIARKGFDCVAERHLFGTGVVMTTDACKAVQQCSFGDNGCIIVARVVLGHPFVAQGPIENHERPPLASTYGVPHDSIIAHPGITNGQIKGKGKGKQTHCDFVVPRGNQSYPGLIIHFTCRA